MVTFLNFPLLFMRGSFGKDFAEAQKAAKEALEALLLETMLPQSETVKVDFYANGKNFTFALAFAQAVETLARIPTMSFPMTVTFYWRQCFRKARL